MENVGGEDGIELYLRGIWSDERAAGTYHLAPPWEPYPTQCVAVACEDAAFSSMPELTNSPHPLVDKVILIFVKQGEHVTSLPMVRVQSDRDIGEVALPEGKSSLSLQIHPSEGQAITRCHQTVDSQRIWIYTTMHIISAVSPEDANTKIFPDCCAKHSVEELFGQNSADFNLTGFLDTPPVMINFKNLLCQKKIGSGSEGNVFQCQSPFNAYSYAVKEVEPEVFFERAKHREPSDVTILSTLNNNNVVKMFLSWSEMRSIRGRIKYTTYTAMELCSRSLKKYLHETPEVDLTSAYSIFKQILSGLRYIHGKGVVHRDIKPGNLLLQENLQVKIADFGIAKRKEPPQYMAFNGGLYGSLPYRAPELVNMQEKHDEKVDIFSTGMVYFAIFMPGVEERRRKVHQLSKCIRESVRDFDNQMMPFDLDLALERTYSNIMEGWKGNYNFLKMMTDPDWFNRPSAAEMLEIFELDNE